MIGLKCIFDVEKSPNLSASYIKTYLELKERYGKGEFKSFDKYNELFENYRDQSSYAKRTHTGKIKEGIELTELELSMVCDDGFSHFGGNSTINSDRTFTVVIFTD